MSAGWLLAWRSVLHFGSMLHMEIILSIMADTCQMNVVGQTGLHAWIAFLSSRLPKATGFSRVAPPGGPNPVLFESTGAKHPLRADKADFIMTSAELVAEHRSRRF